MSLGRSAVGVGVPPLFLHRAAVDTPQQLLADNDLRLDPLGLGGGRLLFGLFLGPLFGGFGRLRSAHTPFFSRLGLFTQLTPIDCSLRHGTRIFWE